MIERLSKLILTIVIIIFLVIFILGLHRIMLNYLHDRYQWIFRHHNKWYWPVKFRFNPKCLPGCRADKTCPRGNLCYNCKGPNATCCCYDSQCEGCNM